MLHTLRIENLALMDAVSLEFEKGYTALTGETGAGKSVLLGALSLLSGTRADKTLIRQGSETCTLECALFLDDVRQVDSTLSEMGLPECEENLLLIRRIISNRKPSRILVNGATATLSQLQEIGKTWIDFHGPGEPQKLFHESEQLALLDLYAGLRDSLAEYASRFREWRRQMEEIGRLRNETRISSEEAAFLQSQVEEIDSLNLSEERVSQLEQDFRRISGAQDLRNICAQLDEGFLGSKGVCGKLQAVLPLAHKLAELDPTAAHLADRVESLVIEANDLSTEWRSLAMSMDFDPAQIKEIESDMDKWLNLRRRFGATADAVLLKRKEMAERLSIQGDLEGAIERKQAEADKLHRQIVQLAAKLRSNRLKAANTLAHKGEALLRDLGFKRPKLGIEILKKDKLSLSGDSECTMTFAPNPGSGLLPLSKIASSGEMARVMLALKSVLAEVDSTPVLVFDEVDSNIGGEVATSVARLLAKLGDKHQVFCITHLPQVAAVAKNHYVVRKDQGEESTSITIRSLGSDKSERIDEFARMLGDRSSDSARRHAKELLSD